MANQNSLLMNLGAPQLAQALNLYHSPQQNLTPQQAQTNNRIDPLGVAGPASHGVGGFIGSMMSPIAPGMSFLKGLFGG